MTKEDTQRLKLYLQDDEKALNILQELLFINYEKTKKCKKLINLRKNYIWIIMYGVLGFLCYSIIGYYFGREIYIFAIKLCLLAIVLIIINKIIDIIRIRLINKIRYIYESINQNDVKYINDKLKENKIKEQFIKEDRIITAIHYLQIKTIFSINEDFITVNENVKIED